MSPDEERIKELSYKIGHIELDIKNLERTIEIKRKHRLLDSEMEQALKQRIGARRREIELMHAEIRKIENEAVRSRNLQEGLGL